MWDPDLRFLWIIFSQLWHTPRIELILYNGFKHGKLCFLFDLGLIIWTAGSVHRAHKRYIQGSAMPGCVDFAPCQPTTKLSNHNLGYRAIRNWRQQMKLLVCFLKVWESKTVWCSDYKVQSHTPCVVLLYPLRTCDPDMDENMPRSKRITQPLYQLAKLKQLFMKACIRTTVLYFIELQNV